MMYGYGYGYDHAWMFGGLIMILFWFLVIAVIAAAIKYLFAGKHGQHGRSARDILDDTYARGELSRDEYFQKRDDLQKK